VSGIFTSPVIVYQVAVERRRWPLGRQVGSFAPLCVNAL
jgi:hypothetical protein